MSSQTTRYQKYLSSSFNCSLEDAPQQRMFPQSSFLNLLSLVSVKRLHSEHSLRTAADGTVWHLTLQSKIRASSGHFTSPVLSQCSWPGSDSDSDQGPLQQTVMRSTDQLYWPKAASGKCADDWATFPRSYRLFIKGGKTSTDLSKELMRRVSA